MIQSSVVVAFVKDRAGRTRCRKDAFFPELLPLSIMPNRNQNKTEMGKTAKQNFIPPEGRQQPYIKPKAGKSPRKLTPSKLSQFDASTSGIPSIISGIQRRKNNSTKHAEQDSKNPNEAVRHPSHKSPPGSLRKGHTIEDLSKADESDTRLGNRDEVQKVLKEAKKTLNPQDEHKKQPPEASKTEKEKTLPADQEFENVPVGRKTVDDENGEENNRAKLAKLDQQDQNKADVLPNEGNNSKKIDNNDCVSDSEDMEADTEGEDEDVMSESGEEAVDDAAGKIEIYTIVFEFTREDSDILKCPVDVSNVINRAGITSETIDDVIINTNRNLLVIKTKSKEQAERWLRITSLGNKNVNARWAKQSSISSF